MKADKEMANACVFAWIIIVLLWAAVFLPSSAHAVPPSIRCVEHSRSRWTPRQFQLLFPCPSTGRKVGACPGWVKDHVVSLCSGGLDLPCNIAWQTDIQSRRKDLWENTVDAPAKLEECRRTGDCFAPGNWPRPQTCN